MSKLQRFNSVIAGLLMILFGAVLIYIPFIGTDLISIAATVTLLAMGIRNLYYYVTMARHMVGGRRSLFYGIILTDLALCAYMIKSFHPLFILIYLIVIHAVYGITDIMVAVRAIKLKSRSWRIKLLTGIGNLGIGVLAVYFWFTEEDVFKIIYIYALGIAYTGVMRIANAFRRTAVPYIQ